MTRRVSFASAAPRPSRQRRSAGKGVRVAAFTQCRHPLLWRCARRRYAGTRCADCCLPYCCSPPRWPSRPPSTSGSTRTAWCTTRTSRTRTPRRCTSRSRRPTASRIRSRPPLHRARTAAAVGGPTYRGCAIAQPADNEDFTNPDSLVVAVRTDPPLRPGRPGVRDARRPGAERRPADRRAVHHLTGGARHARAAGHGPGLGRRRSCARRPASPTTSTSPRSSIPPIPPGRARRSRRGAARPAGHGR